MNKDGPEVTIAKRLVDVCFGWKQEGIASIFIGKNRDLISSQGAKSLRTSLVDTVIGMKDEYKLEELKNALSKLSLALNLANPNSDQLRVKESLAKDAKLLEFVLAEQIDGKGGVLDNLLKDKTSVEMTPSPAVAPPTSADKALFKKYDPNASLTPSSPTVSVPTPSYPKSILLTPKKDIAISSPDAPLAEETDAEKSLFSRKSRTLK